MKKGLNAKALATFILLSWSPVLAQNGTNFVEDTKKQIVDTLNTKQEKWNTYYVDKENNVAEKSHEIIIKMEFDDILELYGQERWMEIIIKHFLIEVNNERGKIWSKPLIINEKLNKLSYEHSKEMADSNYFSHRDLKWNIPAARAIWKYKFQEYSENISYNTNNIKDIVSNYVWSKDRKSWHYRLFEDRFTEVWFGIAKASNWGYLTTANYAIPKK